MGDERGIREKAPWCVARSSLYRVKHVTRSELTWKENSKWGKVLDKVSGLLFFNQKKKFWDLNVADTAGWCHVDDNICLEKNTWH